ncbi:MAG: hypothetical protein ABIF01_01395 [Candidatus Micrarchaeota archaeon]
MAVEDLLISTGVDNLIRLVHDAGRIELKEAAKHLGLSSGSVEEWARVLEEEGLIKLEYQLTKIFLIWVGTSPKDLARKSEQLADKKAELAKDIETMIVRLGARGEELDKIEGEFRKVTELLDPKFGGLKRRLDALREIEKEKDSIFDSHVARMEHAKEEYRKLNVTLGMDEGRAAEMQEKLKEVQGSIEKIEPELAALGPMRKNITELVARLSQEAKMVSGALSEHREALQNLDLISKDLKQRRNSLGEMEEKVGRISSEIQGLIKELEIISKQAEEQRRAETALEGMRGKVEEFERQRSRLESLHESVNRESKEVLQKAGGVLRVIDELEGRFKEVKRLEGTRGTPVEEYLKKLSEIKEQTKADLKEISSLDAKAMGDIARAKTELEKQLSEMRELTKSFDGIAEKKRELDEICARITDMQDERRKLFSQLALISKEMELVNIQASPPGSPVKDLKVDELMGKIEVVRKDQEEFDKRRVELRSMIEKMLGSDRRKKGK